MVTYFIKLANRSILFQQNKKGLITMYQTYAFNMKENSNFNTMRTPTNVGNSCVH